MARRRRLWALCAAAILPALAGCVDGAATVDSALVSRCETRIAVFGPLTGISANLGLNIKQGVDLAVAQANTAAPDCPIQAVDVDSQADPKQAPALAQDVVADPRMLGVVGPSFSGESQAADPLLNQGGVPTITPSATEAALSSRGWGVFHRVLGNDAEQGPAAGRYIEDVLKSHKVFVVDDTQAYGHGLATEVMAVLGPRVVQNSTVLPGQTDFSALVASLRSADPDTIFYGGYYDEAGILVRQMRAAGITARFVAGDGVKDEGFLSRAGSAAAEGTVISCPCRPPETAGDEFLAQYNSMFGRPPGTYSAEAYDAATVFVRGIRAGKLSRKAMAAWVDAYDEPGITSQIRFTPTGELVNSSVTVWAYQVRDGVIVADQKIPGP